MGTAAADFAKKARESDSPPHNTQGYLGGQSVKNGKGETTYTAPKNQKLRQFRNCRSRFSASKAAMSPVLAGPDTQTVSAGILAHASSALGKRLLGKIQ